MACCGCQRIDKRFNMGSPKNVEAQGARCWEPSRKHCMGLHRPILGPCRTQRTLGATILEVNQSMVGATAERYTGCCCGLGCKCTELGVAGCERDGHDTGNKIEEAGKACCTILPTFYAEQNQCLPVLSLATCTPNTASLYQQLAVRLFRHSGQAGRWCPIFCWKDRTSVVS